MAIRTGSRRPGYPPSAEERRAFLAQHLVYEIEMVLNLSTMLMQVNGHVQRLRAKPEIKLSVDERIQLVTYFSLLESWTVHNRILMEFFRPSIDAKTGLPFVDGRRAHYQTAVAEDFVKDHKDWVIWRAGEPATGYKQLTNERIVHLSYGRLGPQAPWKLEYASENMKAAARFLEQIDDSMILSETKERLQRSLRSFFSGRWLSLLEKMPPPGIRP